MILPAILTLMLALSPQEPGQAPFTVVAGAPSVSSSVLGEVRQESSRALTVLRETFPHLPRQPFRIYVHPDVATMPAVLRGFHHAGSPGFALLARHEVHLIQSEVAGAGKGFWPVILHELTHELLYQHNPRFGLAVPRWFHEGFAQLLANDNYLGGSEEAIVWRVARQQLLPFYSLEGDFPREPDAMKLAYAQSYSYVAWLDRQFGRALLVEVVGDVDEQTTFEQALVIATGRSTSDLADAWRDYLLNGSGAAWRSLMAQFFSLTVVLSLPLLALAMIRRMRQDQVARRRLEAQDAAWDTRGNADGSPTSGAWEAPRGDDGGEDVPPLPERDVRP